MYRCATAFCGLLFLLFLADSPGALGAPANDGQPEFTIEPGWTWHLPPMPAHMSSMAVGGIVIHVDEVKDAALLLHLAVTNAATKDAVQIRPMAFAADGKPIEFTSRGGGGMDGMMLSGFSIDLKATPRDQIQYIGIAKLTKQALREVVGPAAFQELKTAGLNALPRPEVGKPYPFELTSIDGQRITSADLRGKVVLLDFWAGWCSPCMAKMPKLKETYSNLHERGLEIVGLNHDMSLDEAKQTILKAGLPWSQVFAPADDKRQQWLYASGTSGLPRLLLIDRDGVLSADTTPGKLDAEIAKLMDNQ
jgi:thiol-disulfide isomerase/thioredoxin